MAGLMPISRLDYVNMPILDNVSGIVILVNKDLSGTGIEFLFGSSLLILSVGLGCQYHAQNSLVTRQTSPVFLLTHL